MPPYSVVFLGTPDFAIPSLEALIADPDFSVDLVITQPDKPVGRKQVITPPPVKIVAEKHGIPVDQPEDVNDFLLTPTLTLTPDFIVAVAYGQILPEEILTWPTIAPVNLHPSLLPRWRGASPIQNAILAGDTETGVTIQKLVKELDAGPILAQTNTHMAPRETAESLHDRLAQMGAELLIETLKQPLTPQPQNPEKVTVCHKLSRKDGEVDPRNMTAEEIDLRVRALVPWPGVRCEIEGQPVKLLETSLKPVDEALALPCTNATTLYVRTLQTPGKRPMTGQAWERGRGNRKND